jgi:hypothetical protein
MLLPALMSLCAGAAPDSGAQLQAAGLAAGAAVALHTAAMLAATAAVYGVDVAVLAESQAAGRPLTPDEVAAVVEFACTAGTVVHGSVLNAAGGFDT